MTSTRKPGMAVIAGTLYLIAYCIFLSLPALEGIAWIMLLFWPFLLIWVALTILKHGTYRGQELNGEEFGYQDKNKTELGIF
jgi:hypothetical protein